MVIQHVLSSEIPDAYDQMRITLESIAELGLQTVLSYPNSDAGGQQMIKAIDLFSDLPNLFAKNIQDLNLSTCFVGRLAYWVTLVQVYLRLHY